MRLELGDAMPDFLQDGGSGVFENDGTLVVN